MIKLPFGFGIVDAESLENLKQKSILQQNLIDSQNRLISAQKNLITSNEKLLSVTATELQLMDKKLKSDELYIMALRVEAYKYEKLYTSSLREETSKEV